MYGREGLARLKAAQVAVVGVGGVGSWVVEGLARSGVGALTLIDMDDLCVTNTNRQLPALEGNVGRSKVSAMAERVRLINPGCVVTERAEYYTAATEETLLSGGFSAVVDAIDDGVNKAGLIAACVRRGLACVTVGGAGGRREATGVKAGDLGEAWGDELLRQVRKRLRRDHGFAGGEGNRYGVRCVWSAERQVFPRADGTCGLEPEKGSSLRLDCASGFGTAVFVTAAFGMAAAGEVVRGLVEGD